MQSWVLLESLMPLALLAVVLRLPSRSTLRCDQVLCDAASIGDLRRIAALLADGVSPDSADEDGSTALMSAAFAAQTKAVRALLAAGADPDLEDTSGMTALMNAVIAAGEMDLEAAVPVYREIIELLLAAGADPGLQDRDGCTALEHAESYGLRDLVDLL